MARNYWLLPLFVFACFVPGTEVRAQDKFYRPELKDKDIDRGLRTDWHGIYLKGLKIGYSRTDRRREGNTVIETSQANMKFVSMGIKAELNATQTMTYEARPPHRLLKASSVEDDGRSRVTIAANRLDDKTFDYVVEVGDQRRVRKMNDLGYGLSDAIGSEVWIRTSPKVGDSILCKDLDLKKWEADSTKYTVKAVKKSLVNAVEVTYFEVNGTSRKRMISNLSRNDSNGNMLQTTIADLFDLRKESEADAKNTKYSHDLFVLGQARIDKEIGFTTQLTELVLEIKGKVGTIFEDGPNQSVVRKGEGDIRWIRAGKKYGKQVKATAKEIEENLTETTAYAITNEKVTALARKAVGDAKTPEEKVKRITSFVKRYIRPSLSAAALPNIHTLLEDKKGDCKCYALLTVNLCRAAGVPAREVSGLLYMGDDVKAFGGHAWNEVVLDGVWVPVDASLNQVGVDAGHLCMGTDEKATKATIESLGKLSFRVIEASSR